eukprot:9471630-Pyramimonas_sp.AAC.1
MRKYARGLWRAPGAEIVQGCAVHQVSTNAPHHIHHRQQYWQLCALSQHRENHYTNNNNNSSNNNHSKTVRSHLPALRHSCSGSARVWLCHFGVQSPIEACVTTVAPFSYDSAASTGSLVCGDGPAAAPVRGCLHHCALWLRFTIPRAHGQGRSVICPRHHCCRWRCRVHPTGALPLPTAPGDSANGHRMTIRRGMSGHGFRFAVVHSCSTACVHTTILYPVSAAPSAYPSTHHFTAYVTAREHGSP